MVINYFQLFHKYLTNHNILLILIDSNGNYATNRAQSEIQNGSSETWHQQQYRSGITQKKYFFIQQLYRVCQNVKSLSHFIN